MSWQKHSYEFLVRETDLDSYGHMNNATYLRHFEDARWECTTQKGRGYYEYHALGQGPVILELNVKFAKEVKLRQAIKVETQIMEYHGKVGLLRQQMRSESGELLCEATFKMGILDFKTRKLIVPTSDWLEVLGYQPALV